MALRSIGGAWPVQPEPAACPHEDCEDYGEARRGNVRFETRYGTGRWALFRCRTCDRTFSERKATPFFRLQVPESKILDGLERLSRGHSIRTVAKALSIDKNTVLKILRLASRQPRWFQVFLPRRYEWGAARADALYDFIHARRKRELTRARQRRAGAGP